MPNESSILGWYTELLHQVLNFVDFAPSFALENLILDVSQAFGLWAYILVK
jgi:hypothetical protein